MTTIGMAVTTALLVVMAQGPFAHPEIDLRGRLYRAVFVAGPGTLSSGDLASVPEPFRARLSRFLTRRSSFTSIYEGAPADVIGVARDAKRRELERAIVALIEVDGIAQRALAFVKDVPVAYEWEGQPEGPLAESAFAAKVLQIDPATPLAPFLHLFMAQRLRAASEAAEFRGNGELARTSAARAAASLQKARAASDPIFGLIADDLERLPVVYVKKKEPAGKAQ